MSLLVEDFIIVTFNNKLSTDIYTDNLKVAKVEDIGKKEKTNYLRAIYKL